MVFSSPAQGLKESWGLRGLVNKKIVTKLFYRSLRGAAEPAEVAGLAYITSDITSSIAVTSCSSERTLLLVEDNTFA